MTKQKLWVLSNLSAFMSRSVLDFCLLILFLSPIYRKFSQEKFHPDFSLMSNSGNWSLRPKWFLPQNPSGHKRDKDWQCPASKLHYFYLVSSVYSKALASLFFPIYSPISLDRMVNSKVIVYRDWSSKRQALKMSFDKWSNVMSFQSRL